jgi:hypothetical protein
MGGVVLCLGRAAWSFGGAAFPTPPSFFYTSLLPPAATDRTLALLVATQRCVSVAYDCLAVASAAARVMGLGRKFSNRRLVVSVAIGVMVATLADVGVRMSARYLGWQRRILARESSGSREVQVKVADGWIYMDLYPSLLADQATGVWMPDGIGKLDPAATSTDMPAWGFALQGPFCSLSRSRAAYLNAFGLPLRSSVSEKVFMPARVDSIGPVMWWRGDVWFPGTDVRKDTVHRIRVLPALFNVACFTVVAWAALTGFAAVRRARRRSRGGCLVCGYAIGTLAVCPECGTAGRGVAASAASPTGGGVMSGTDGPNDS